MLDLGSKPFYLDEDGIRWVISTRLAMSEEEKLLAGKYLEFFYNSLYSTKNSLVEFTNK